MHSRERDGADRGRRRRRPDDRVAARERGRDQLGRHRVGPVPRADHADDAARAAEQHHALARRERVRDLAAEPLGVLGRHPPVLDELVDLVVGLGPQRLALVERQRARERVTARLDHVADRVHLRRALERRHPRPAARRRSRAAAIAARRVLAVALPATVPIVSPVAGLVASNVSPVRLALPLAVDEHLPRGAGVHGRPPLVDTVGQLIYNRPIRSWSTVSSRLKSACKARQDAATSASRKRPASRDLGRLIDGNGSHRHGDPRVRPARAGRLRLQAGARPLARVLLVVRRGLQLHLDPDRRLRAVRLRLRATRGRRCGGRGSSCSSARCLVALCFAELAGQFPLAGSVYQWSKRIGTDFVSWMTGWISDHRLDRHRRRRRRRLAGRAAAGHHLVPVHRRRRRTPAPTALRTAPRTR